MNLVEGLHEALTHSAKRRVVKVGVIRDQAHDAVSSRLDALLSDSDELDVVVLKPVPSFAKVLPIHHLVWLDQGTGLRRHVDRKAGVRRVPEYHHDRQLALHFTGAVGLLGEPAAEEGELAVLALVCLLKRVREVHAQALALFDVVAGLFEAQA